MKVKVKVKFKGMTKMMVLGTQIKFPENLVKIGPAGASVQVILRVAGGGWIRFKFRDQQKLINTFITLSYIGILFCILKHQNIPPYWHAKHC